MPVKITKVKGGFSVSTPHGVKAKKTTLKKAQSQKRLLNAVEHGFVPTGHSSIFDKISSEAKKKRR